MFIFVQASIFCLFIPSYILLHRIFVRQNTSICISHYAVVPIQTVVCSFSSELLFIFNNLFIDYFIPFCFLSVF